MDWKNALDKICILTGLILMPCSMPAQISVHIAENSTVHTIETDWIVSGDWYNTGSWITADSRIIFNGNEDQFLRDSAGNSYSQLVVRKPAGVLYLSDSLRIADSLSLIAGKVASSDTSLLILLSSAGINGSDSASFVDGPMAKVYDVSVLPVLFCFPTGRNSDFRPVTVYFTEVVDDSITVSVQQFNHSARDLSTTTNGLDKVSSVRYWHIRKEGPGNFDEVQITLSYDTVSTNDGVEMASELRVAQLDTMDAWIWNDIGGSGSADFKGTIVSNPILYLGSGYFTFGDASGGADISLPVFLSFLDLSEKRGDVIINWKSASEVNNLCWLVQRKEESDSTAAFETIARIEGQINKSTDTEYTLVDRSAAPGNSYAYRLVDVSTSGRQHFSQPVTILVGLPGRYQLTQNFPNPFNSVTRFLYDLPVNSEVKVELYSITGQKVATLVSANQPAGYYELIWDARNTRGIEVASGMYLLAMQARGIKDGLQDNFTQVKKIMLLK